MDLNQRALRSCLPLLEDPGRFRATVVNDASGTRIVDCGVHAEGGLAAGICLAETCMAGLGRITMESGDRTIWSGPWISVSTDHPVAACMAAQYAGWRIADNDYFAMGSGPMRAAAGHEDLFDRIGMRERPAAAVGVLECAEYPPETVCRQVAGQCGVSPLDLLLLVARTASTAGCLQVVARSIETALHQLLELDFDLLRVVSGWGVAPLPPVARDDLAAIGRTNDAILYGTHVTLWVHGDDDSLEKVGARIPSTASPDHGQPFAAIFQAYDHDFYRIDPSLFSPARIQLINVDTGRSMQFGHFEPDVLRRSFSG